jgi:hypothetical protein
LNRSHQNRFASKSLNFRQWSRKGYAIFCSLGKTVRIAVLKMALSARMTTKNNAEGTLDEVRLSNFEAEHEEPGIENLLTESLLGQYLLVIEPVACEYQPNKSIQLIYRCPADFCR